MSGIAAALARGLAGYAQNRMMMDERDYRRQQDEQARERQAMLDARQQEMMRLQLESMRAAMGRAEQDAARQGELDRRNAFEGGYRPVEQVQSQSRALAPAGGALAASGGPMGMAGSMMGSMAEALRGAAQTPAYSVGGTPMAKAAESLTERQNRLEAQRREGETLQQREWMLQQANDAEKRAIAREDRQFARQRSLQGPKEPKLITGNDGNMYRYDDRTGRLLPVPVAGMQPAGPSSDAMRPTQVPAMPGDNLLRGLGQPTQAPAATQYSGGQAQASPYGGGGLFGKPKAAPPKYVEQVNALDTMDALLKQYENSLDKVNPSIMQGSDANMADANAAYQNLILSAKEAFNLGVLNGPDLEILQNTITPPVGALAKIRGKEAIKKTIERARATNALKRSQLNRSYSQFPTQDARPATADDINSLANAFMGGRNE